MVRNKLEAIWRIITSGHIYLLTQRNTGDEIEVSGGGLGDVKDMLLMARAMKLSYDHFIAAIEHLAVEEGELHLLRELRDAIETIVPEGEVTVKEQNGGREQ